MSSQEAVPSFRVRVNMVLVRAVVRDQRGSVISDLHKEDFRIFDNRKLQDISQFSVETTDAEAAKTPQNAQPTATESPRKPPTMAKRFLALFFDDVHTALGDLMVSREAAGRFIDTSTRPDDRLGIFTSSGLGDVDFTDDRQKLHAGLEALRPRPSVADEPSHCPDVDQYLAFKIVHQNDPQAINVLAWEIVHCDFNDDANQLPQATQMVLSYATRALSAGQTQTQYTLRGLEGLIRRMSALPGQRNIILVSPGFIMLGDEKSEWDLADRAVREGVIINSLDARGLYTPPGQDISRADFEAPPIVEAAIGGQRQMYRTDAAIFSSEVLADLASGTGGQFFQNNNDLESGFRRLGTPAAVAYILGFVPGDEKYDGRFHTIEVKVAPASRYVVQARRGYFAPDQAQDAETRAKEDIEDAIFSQEPLDQIPVDVHTQFFRVDQNSARISVLAHVDTKYVPFRKADGRNLDNLTFVAALFDNNGKYLTAKEKVLQMRLFDATRARLSHSGILTKTNFDVQPGTYLVRMVVRDSEGALISAQSRTVEIP